MGCLLAKGGGGGALLKAGCLSSGEEIKFSADQRKEH